MAKRGTKLAEVEPGDRPTPIFTLSSSRMDPSLRRKLFLRLTIVKCYHYDDEDGGGKEEEGAGQARSHPPSSLSAVVREQQSAQEVAETDPSDTPTDSKPKL